MGSGYQFRVGCQCTGSSIGAGNAYPGQTLAHGLGAGQATGTHRGHAGQQLWVVLIKAQAQDVDGLSGKGHRDLDPGHKSQAQILAGGARRRDARDLVVVGQRPQLHPGIPGPLGQLLR